MKALVKSRAEPGIWMEDIAIPTIGPNDVLIRMRKTAICGTDMHIWHWDDWAKRTIPVPMAVGHEYCGEIVEIGLQCALFVGVGRLAATLHIVEDLPTAFQATADAPITPWGNESVTVR